MHTEGRTAAHTRCLGAPVEVLVSIKHLSSGASHSVHGGHSLIAR